MKQFTHFHKEIFMVLEAAGGCCESMHCFKQSPGVAVKPYMHFYDEILMVSEASGGCSESMADGLESPGGCCESICTLLH